MKTAFSLLPLEHQVTVPAVAPEHAERHAAIGQAHPEEAARLTVPGTSDDAYGVAEARTREGHAPAGHDAASLAAPPAIPHAPRVEHGPDDDGMVPRTIGESATEPGGLNRRSENDKGEDDEHPHVLAYAAPGLGVNCPALYGAGMSETHVSEERTWG